MNASFLTTLRVFVPFAAGYFLSYLYRVVNAVIAPDLVGDLGIGPSALGLLTSTYFISFASFQLPLGVLLDRYGPGGWKPSCSFSPDWGLFSSPAPAPWPAWWSPGH
jgi:MFS family permease